MALLAVGSALFMQFMDSTALSTALPTLAHQFDSSPVHLRLVLTTYMIVQALFLPASGWAADRFGARRVFMAAMAVFLVGSALAGFSQSLPQLVGARIVQGLGGAMMMPVARIIVVGSSPRSQLLQAMMWLTMPALIGPIVGPPLAGLIISVADWPWIFFVNIPIGLLGMLAVWRFVPRLTRPHPGAFDFVGFLISVVFIAAVMTIMEATGASVLLQLLSVAVAIPAAAVYVLHARRRVARGGSPVLDLSLYRRPTFRLSQMGGSLVRIGIGGTPYLLALLLQIGLKLSPLHAGLITVASAVGALAARPLGTRAVKAFGFRRVLMASAVLVGVLGALPGFFRYDTPVALILVVLCATGFTRALQFSSINALSYAEIPQSQVSAASTISSVGQQITLSLGITVGGVMLQIAQGGSRALSPPDFVLPFLVVGGLAVVSVFFYGRMPASAGSDISGHRSPRV